MPVELSYNRYGKSHVRLAKLKRHAGRHELMEMTVHISLEGEYERAYMHGDNRELLPTDTLKNTVFALAQKTDFSAIEEFGVRLVEHFLENNPQIIEAMVEIDERKWQRISSAGDGQTSPAPYAFVAQGGEARTCEIVSDRNDLRIVSGLKDLSVIKTTGYKFENFKKDEYTTVQDISDRVFATSLEAHWSYVHAGADFDRCYSTARAELLDTFAQHDSQSVQHLLYALGRAVLERCAEMSDIHLVMPNRHYLPVDLSSFGLQNDNEIFLPTVEPFGMIEGTVSRYEL